MFYILNRVFKSQTILTIGFLASGTPKLDTVLIDFDKLVVMIKPKKRGIQTRETKKILNRAE